MSSINTKDSSNSQEKENPKKNNGNIQSLLSESIYSELKTRSNVIDPILFGSIKYPEIYSSIRDKMKFLRDTDDNFVDITDTQIIAISDAKIIEKIEIFAQPLKNARRNLYTNIRKTFSNIREKIPGFNEDILGQKIENLNENEIVAIYHSNRTLGQFIFNYFGVSTESLAFKNYDFMTIFGTDDLRNDDPDLYSRTEAAAIKYKKYGIAPNFDLIGDLIGHYDRTNGGKKKEICDFFDVIISIPDGLKAGLITENDIEAIALKEFASVWDNLDGDSQQSLIRVISNDDNYMLELASFDTNKIDRHFSSKKMKDILTRAITTSLTKNEDTPNKKQGITRDLVPEIGNDGIPRIHNSFLRLVKNQVIQKNGTPKIQKIEKLTEGSVLIFTDEAERTRYFKIDKTDASIGEYDYGVIISDITGKEFDTVGNIKDTSSIDYDTFYEFIKHINSGRVLSGAEFQSLRTDIKTDEEIGQDHINGEGKILDISATESVATLEGFTREINLLDPDGEAIGLGVGTTFTSKGVLENGESYEGVWKINLLDAPNISVINRTGIPESTTFDNFLEIVKKQGFKRIAKLETQEDLLHTLHDFGVDDHAQIKGNKLVLENDSHGHGSHDSHGHGSHDQSEKIYEFFQSKSGGHIRINGFTDGLVSFGEYTSPNALADVQKKGNAGKLSEKDKKGLYTHRTVSYGEFIDYLKKNQMKATTDNILVPNVSDAYHPHDPHFEDDFSSFMSKVGSWWSISDIMKGFSNLTHGVEHYFEKSSKLNASRFALSMGRNLGLPLDIMAQLQADEVSGVKEIIEKIQEKLKNLNGPVARKKALHIAHNRNARPEEVGAAILHMIKGYGHLYAEDIAYAQGSESFLNGLLNACGFHGQELIDMKKKARQKSKVLLGNEAGSDLSEEEVIWGFMKTMDGNSEKYPVAATLVKAMGGPSGFENAWRKDGFDGAYEKGIRQAGDLVNAEARVDHGLSALSTHEFHTAIGSMEKAAEKNPSPDIQTLPVVWALGGYSQYLSTKANQKIKSYVDGKGHSFHAFAFLRTRIDNDIYRHTFREALKEVAPEDVGKMDDWIHDLSYSGHENPDKKGDIVKAAINGLAGIWRQHNGKLHDMLQGKNMWLVAKSNDDDEVKKYLKKLSDGHQNNSGDEAHGDDNGWYIQNGYVGSPIVKAVDVNGYTLNSMERTLRKIKLDSHQFRIDKNHKERYWDPAVKMVTNLAKSPQSEDLKKAQFLQYRKDILLRFNEAFSRHGDKFADIKKQEFYIDFLDMGIDMSVIFEPGSNPEKKIKKTEEKDYIAWKNGGHQGGNATTSEVQSVRDTVNSMVSYRQDAGFQGAGRNRDNRRDPPSNTDEQGDGIPGLNDLSDGSGPD